MVSEQWPFACNQDILCTPGINDNFIPCKGQEFRKAYARIGEIRSIPAALPMENTAPLHKNTENTKCEAGCGETDRPTHMAGAEGTCADKFQSVHRDASKATLEQFSLVSVLEELYSLAPVLMTVLTESCPPKKTEDEKKQAVLVSVLVLVLVL